MSDENDLDEAFRSGSIFTSSPEDQNRYLRALGLYNVNGPESFRSRAIIRALTLNHLQMAGVIRDLETTIKRLNEENGKLAFRVLVFTLVATGGTVVQAVIAYILFLRIS